MNRWFLQLKKLMLCLSSKVHKLLKEMSKTKNQNPKNNNNKSKDQKINLIEVSESKVLIFQEAKNKEWLSQDQFWETQLSYYWMKPHRPWIIKIKRKYKTHLIKLWKKELQFQSPTELIQLKTVMKSMSLTMVESLKVEHTVNWLAKKVTFTICKEEQTSFDI